MKGSSPAVSSCLPHVICSLVLWSVCCCPVVGETGTSASPRTGSGFANPTIIDSGDDKVTLTAPHVSEPRGVAYACNGIGHWLTAKRKGWSVDEEDVAVVNKQLLGLIDLLVDEVYE